MLEITLDEKYLKTYETEENLRKAVKDLPGELSYLIAYTKSGRCTPVFTNAMKEAWAGQIAARGYKVVG